MHISLTIAYSPYTGSASLPAALPAKLGAAPVRNLPFPSSSHSLPKFRTRADPAAFESGLPVGMCGTEICVNLALPGCGTARVARSQSPPLSAASALARLFRKEFRHCKSLGIAASTFESNSSVFPAGKYDSCEREERELMGSSFAQVSASTSGTSPCGQSESRT